MKAYSKKQIGDKGEYYAAKYLKKLKFEIIEKNFWTDFGEIDIIAENKDLILFVEVKTRHLNSDLRPSVSVTKTKQNKILKSAFYYLKLHSNDKQPRLDIVEVFIDPRNLKCVSVNHIENAFEQGGTYAAF